MSPELKYLPIVGIPLPEKFNDELFKTQQRLRDLNPFILPSRAPRSHITLLRLNPMTESDLAETYKQLTARKFSFPVIDISIQGIAEFKPRVGFISLKAQPQQEIEDLSQLLALELDGKAQAGIKGEPHVQISKCQFARTRKDAVARFNEIVSILDPISWRFSLEQLYISAVPDIRREEGVDQSRLYYF
jgi:2'-5' RNA ligase